MAKAELAVPSVRGVFLSHHYLDHVADLQPRMLSHWLFSNNAAPLSVHGTLCTQALVDGPLATSREIERPSFPVGGKPKLPITQAAIAIDIAPGHDAVAVYKN